MKVLMVVDVYGWAFDIVARGIKKYSRNNIDIKIPSEITLEDSKNYDVIVFSNAMCWHKLPEKVKIPTRLHGKIFCGIRSEKLHLDTLRGKIIEKVPFDIIFCNTSQIMKQGISDKLVRIGVDTEIFKPHPRYKLKKFTVGYAGKIVNFKRTNVFRKVKYPIKIASKTPSKLSLAPHIKVRTYSYRAMVIFYNRIHVYVTPSSSESGAITVLEAMACRLPVIATCVGRIPEYLSQRWTIPMRPLRETINLINEKLDELYNDRELLNEVGSRNREEVLNNWSWKVCVKDWDRLFEL